MYCIIKHNVVDKYIINATTTATNTWNNLSYFGQREAICLLMLDTNKGEHSITYSKYTNIDTIERGEKKSQTS